MSKSCAHVQGSKLELPRDNLEDKKSYGCVSWGIIVTAAIPSPPEPYLLPGVMQEADWPITFTSLFIRMTLLAVDSGTWDSTGVCGVFRCSSLEDFIISVPADHSKLLRLLVGVAFLVQSC